MHHRCPSTLPLSLSFTAGLSGALETFNVQLDEFNYHVWRDWGGAGWMDGWTDGEMDAGKGEMGKNPTFSHTESPSLSL